MEALLSRIAARCVPQRNFAYFGSYTWAGAAVRRFAEFAERMKWQTPCTPVEMLQGYSHENCGNRCRTLARQIAEMMNK